MSPDPALSARGLTVGYGTRAVLADLDLDVYDGEVLALLGPNGSGKSTLLRTLGALQPPLAGTVAVRGHDPARISPRRLARLLAVLPQGPVAPPGLSVRDLVLLGRHPHRGLLARPGRADHAAVAEALELTGTATFAEREVASLSGGERQRVWMALTLAQHANVLLLDEPTTFLDLGHQFELLELVTDLRERRALTVLMVLHDIDQAARFADRIAVVGTRRPTANGAAVSTADGGVVSTTGDAAVSTTGDAAVSTADKAPTASSVPGGLIALGRPADVLDPALLREVFGIDAELHTGSDGALHVLARRAARG